MLVVLLALSFAPQFIIILKPKINIHKSLLILTKKKHKKRSIPRCQTICRGNIGVGGDMAHQGDVMMLVLVVTQRVGDRSRRLVLDIHIVYLIVNKLIKVNKRRKNRHTMTQAPFVVVVRCYIGGEVARWRPRRPINVCVCVESIVTRRGGWWWDCWTYVYL